MGTRFPQKRAINDHFMRGRQYRVANGPIDILQKANESKHTNKAQFFTDGVLLKNNEISKKELARNIEMQICRKIKYQRIQPSVVVSLWACY